MSLFIEFLTLLYNFLQKIASETYSPEICFSSFNKSISIIFSLALMYFI